MANKTTTIHHFVALLLLLRLPLHLYVFAAAASCEEEDFLVREKRQQLPSSRDQVPAGTGRELTIDNLSSAGGTSSSSSKTDGNNNGGVSSSRRLGVDRGTAGIFGVGTTSDNDRRGFSYLSQRQAPLMTGGTGINSQLPGMMGLTGGMGSSNWNGAMGQSVPLVQNPFLGGPFGGASSPFGQGAGGLMGSGAGSSCTVSVTGNPMAINMISGTLIGQNSCQTPFGVFTQQPAAATGQPSWSSVLGGGMGAVGGSVFPQLGQQQQCIHQLMLPGTAGQQGIGGGGGADGCNQLIPNCSVLINGLPSNPFSAIGGQLGNPFGMAGAGGMTNGVQPLPPTTSG